MREGTEKFYQIKVPNRNKSKAPLHTTVEIDLNHRFLIVNRHSVREFKLEVGDK